MLAKCMHYDQWRHRSLENVELEQAVQNCLCQLSSIDRHQALTATVSLTYTVSAKFSGSTGFI